MSKEVSRRSMWGMLFSPLLLLLPVRWGKAQTNTGVRTSTLIEGVGQSWRFETKRETKHYVDGSLSGIEHLAESLFGLAKEHGGISVTNIRSKFIDSKGQSRRLYKGQKDWKSRPSIMCDTNNIVAEINYIPLGGGDAVHFVTGSYTPAPDLSSENS